MGARPVMILRAIAILFTVTWISCVFAAQVALAVDGRAGGFPDVDSMETALKKGISTKTDVEALLGPPVGRGGALSGVEPGRPRDVWVYGEFGWSLIDMKGGVARLHFDQQLLMVYFLGDVFDGFWWHGNADVTTLEGGN